jgi:broad specificity phosphatase PhoE
MEILFIRHGESTENIAMKNNKEYDTNNIVLTNKGIAQAKATAKYIKKVFGKIDCIYHSPVYRCQQTA